MNQKIRDKVAASLRGRRAMNRLTQRELSKQLGVSQTTMCSWEARGVLTAEKLWELADYYGCSIDELIGRDFKSEDVEK